MRADRPRTDAGAAPAALPVAASGTVVASRARHRRDRLGAAAWFVALVLLACHFALNLQQNGRTFLDAEAYVHYEAKRPYQYRVLMAPVLGGLVDAFSQPPVARRLARLPAYVATPVAAAYAAINTVGFVAACLLMAAIARRALGSGVPMRLALAVYVALVYFFFCLNPNVAFILPYDVPALALAQACLLCVLTGRRAWLYPLFVLATLNRESSLLVVVFLGMRAAAERARGDGGATWRGTLVDVVVLTSLWLVIKAGLYLAFAHLPSDEGLRVGHNLRALARPWQWPALLPLLAGFALTLASLRSRAAAHAWALTGCIGFALVFLTGQLLETRAFADLIPFFAVAIAARLLDRPPGRQSRPEWPRMPS